MFPSELPSFVWLAQLVGIGLITAFDVLEATGEANPSIIAGGLKVALLSPLFGLFTFSVSKLAILILRIIQK